MNRFGFLFVCVVSVVVACPAFGWENLLRDPGFEGYRLDRRGFYYLEDGSPWTEVALARGSVQFNANRWTCPDAMLAERPRGFSPGTTGFEGTQREQNGGWLTMQQDVVDPKRFADDGQLYEAWVWLGGGGKDTDTTLERMEEVGGWEIYWYDTTDPSKWQDGDELERHFMRKDFFGKAGSFVQVAGFGRIPDGAKGFRIRVWATTWTPARKPASYETEVALDNAHVAVVDAKNMLINGDFEMDDRVGIFKGWQRPADWPFARNGVTVVDVDNTYASNFDHSQYRPFWGYKRAYGYRTYLCGWGRDAFTFGQTVDYDLPQGTPLLLTFNWIQNVKEPSKTIQVRYVGTNIDIAVEFLGDGKRLGSKGFKYEWPVPPNSKNVCRYDQNCNTVYAPRMILEPPAGTDKVGVHISFNVNMPYKQEYSLIASAVDDFYLVPAERPSP